MSFICNNFVRKVLRSKKLPGEFDVVWQEEFTSVQKYIYPENSWIDIRSTS